MLHTPWHMPTMCSTIGGGITLVHNTLCGRHIWQKKTATPASPEGVTKSPDRRAPFFLTPPPLPRGSEGSYPPPPPSRCNFPPALAVGGGWWLVGVSSGWGLVAVGGWRLTVPEGCPQEVSLTKKSWLLKGSPGAGERRWVRVECPSHGSLLQLPPPVAPPVPALTGFTLRHPLPLSGGCSPPHLKGCHRAIAIGAVG